MPTSATSTHTFVFQALCSRGIRDWILDWKTIHYKSVTGKAIKAKSSEKVHAYNSLEKVHAHNSSEKVHKSNSPEKVHNSNSSEKVYISNYSEKVRNSNGAWSCLANKFWIGSGDHAPQDP
jgi:hypothetical protein